MAQGEEPTWRWAVGVVVVPLLVALVSSPFWFQKVFGGDEPSPPASSAAASPQPKRPTGSEATKQLTGPQSTIDPFAPASIYLNRDSGPLGTTILVSGAGFQPGEQVEITAFPQAGRCARTQADSRGKFSQVACKLPRSSPYNSDVVYVSATGRTSLKHDEREFQLT